MGVLGAGSSRRLGRSRERKDEKADHLLSSSCAARRMPNGFAELRECRDPRAENLPERFETKVGEHGLKLLRRRMPTDRHRPSTLRRSGHPVLEETNPALDEGPSTVSSRITLDERRMVKRNLGFLRSEREPRRQQRRARGLSQPDEPGVPAILAAPSVRGPRLPHRDRGGRPGLPV